MAASSSSPGNNQSSTPLFGLQSQEFQDLYNQYTSLSSAGLSPLEVSAKLSALVQSSWNIPPSAASAMVSIALKKFSSPEFLSSFADAASVPSTSITPTTTSTPSTPSDSASVLQSDLDALYALTSADPSVSFELKTLLLSLLIHYRRYYHPRGWVRYDRRSIMYMASLSSASIKTQEELTSHLHREYGMQMQVIGSNSPSPCFSLPWAKDHSPSPSNPLVDLGPFSPNTVIITVSSLPSLVSPPTP